MFSSIRKGSVARARQAAILLVRRRMAKSLNELGELFDRDHTTIMHACEAAAKRGEDIAAIELALKAITEGSSAGLFDSYRSASEAANGSHA